MAQHVMTKTSLMAIKSCIFLYFKGFRPLATFSSLDDDMAFTLREVVVDLQAVPAK